MNDQELEKIWIAMNTRIDTINERTKNHTYEIRELRKMLIELKGRVKTKWKNKKY